MICLRFDLDYVPWDTANAEKYGHGEPAMVLKLLDLARQTGARFHFFISNRALRTFPSTADAILGEGHDLDWLTHYPDDPDLYDEAKGLFKMAGHQIKGVAITSSWPQELSPSWLTELEFVTAPQGPHLELAFFPETVRFEDEHLSYGLGHGNALDFKDLSDDSHVRTYAARPQVLAKRDPQLGKIKILLSANLQIRTLREMLREQAATGEPEKD